MRESYEQGLGNRSIALILTPSPAAGLSNSSRTQPNSSISATVTDSMTPYNIAPDRSSSDGSEVSAG